MSPTQVRETARASGAAAAIAVTQTTPTAARITLGVVHPVDCAAAGSHGPRALRSAAASTGLGT